MRQTILAVCIGLASCGTESGLEKQESTTFLRYFNGGNKDEAVGFIQATDGGYIILVNSTANPCPACLPTHYIKLIRTSATGNELWTKTVRDEFGCDAYFGSRIVQGDYGNFEVIGTFIPCGMPPLPGKLLIIEGTIDGVFDSRTIGSDILRYRSSKSRVDGLGGTLNSNGNLVILFKTDSLNEIGIAEVDRSKSIIQSKTYPTDILYFVPRLEVLSNNLFVTAGMKLDPGSGGIIQEIIVFDLTLGTMHEVALPYQPGFVSEVLEFSTMIGQVSVYGAGNHSSGNAPGAALTPKFEVYDLTGNTLLTHYYPDLGYKDANQVLKAGASTIDGGHIMLGSMYAEKNGLAKSVFGLLKVDLNGKQEWYQSFGGGNLNEAVAVMQASDGGFVFLGTSTLTPAYVPSVITFIKTDKLGKLPSFK